MLDQENTGRLETAHSLIGLSASESRFCVVAGLSDFSRNGSERTGPRPCRT